MSKSSRGIVLRTRPTPNGPIVASCSPIRSATSLRLDRGSLPVDRVPWFTALPRSLLRDRARSLHLGLQLYRATWPGGCFPRAATRHVDVTCEFGENSDPNPRYMTHVLRQFPPFALETPSQVADNSLLTVLVPRLLPADRMGVA